MHNTRTVKRGTINGGCVDIYLYKQYSSPVYRQNNTELFVSSNFVLSVTTNPLNVTITHILAKLLHLHFFGIIVQDGRLH